MKKLKDMESSFFEKFSEEELEFMAAWEELYFSPEFQEDSRRVRLELILEEVTQKKITHQFQKNEKSNETIIIQDVKPKIGGYFDKITKHIDKNYQELMTGEIYDTNQHSHYKSSSIVNETFDGLEWSYGV